MHLSAWIVELALSVLMMEVATMLFASRLPRREGFGWRICGVTAGAVLGGTLIWTGAEWLISGGEQMDNPMNFAVQLALFSAMLVLLTLSVTRCFDVGVWSALFCSTAGYTLQNFMSGLAELIIGLISKPGIAATDADLTSVTFVFLLAAALTYLPFYLLVIRNIDSRALAEVDDRGLLGIMAVVVFGVINFDLLIRLAVSVADTATLVVGFRVTHGLICCITYALEYELLVNRRLRHERLETQQLLAENARQYERSRKNVEAINVKCHDIRHQIRRLADGPAAVDPEVLADIAREVAIYDSSARTGNEALDTILTEKHLECRRAGITMTVTADGSALDFMSAADIYALFGNALDNAIRAVRELDDPERSSISVVVRQAMGNAVIHVDNYFDGRAPELDGEGLPRSKQVGEGHGFGVRSMRLTVERYGGTLATLVQGDTFHVNAILPLQ